MSTYKLNISLSKKEIYKRIYSHNKLIDYIKEYGYCGLEGTMWGNFEADCEECEDRNECERYNILKERD